MMIRMSVAIFGLALTSAPRPVAAQDLSGVWVAA